MPIIIPVLITVVRLRVPRIRMLDNKPLTRNKDNIAKKLFEIEATVIELASVINNEISRSLKSNVASIGINAKGMAKIGQLCFMIK